MKWIEPEYFQDPDTIRIARFLLGKVIHTHFEGRHVAGMITETEAYLGVNDRASHAYGHRRTQRTETMYRKGGVAYVYLCYGIHHLFNVVTSVEGDPQAVLLRAIQPLVGIDLMLARRGKDKVQKNWVNGPGAATQALGITTQANGLALNSNALIQLWDHGIEISEHAIHTSTRIGVGYAGEDAFFPLRFMLKDQGVE
jgi:DNA-3-methyladenine glycosylase